MLTKHLCLSPTETMEVLGDKHATGIHPAGRLQRAGRRGCRGNKRIGMGGTTKCEGPGIGRSAL